MNEFIFFSIFVVFILFVLLTDLLLVGRKTHIISFREAGLLSGLWISLAFLFYFFLRHFGELIHGVENIADLKDIIQTYSPHLKIDETNFLKSLEIYRKNLSLDYITGYLIEETLSMDNLFVILLILRSFAVSEKDYKKVLFWGILGAIVLRGMFIFSGAMLIRKFEWVLYIFGAFLVYSGLRILITREHHNRIEVNRHPVVKFTSKHFSVFPTYVSNRFFIRKNSKLFITPLFLVVVMIEFTDLLFAVDSIPAIFSVTRDPYIVFFSNIFAIIGLRSLFFFLVNIVNKFRFLKEGISVLLTFVGVKLLLSHWLVKIGFKSVYSLYFILIVLFGSIVLSLLFPAEKAE